MKNMDQVKLAKELSPYEENRSNVKKLQLQKLFAPSEFTF